MEPGVRPPVVVIGRNEGENLRRCLASVFSQTDVVAYVDSGSTDGSPDLARSLGAYVVELDRSRPFTAARARNAGFEFLMKRTPDLNVIQFLDGDCELAEGWLAFSASELDRKPNAAGVCGTRRERYPGRSVFNLLCDLEWDLAGADTFGGDAMVRAEAFSEAGGFNPALIAGEEPDLSLRMRRQGWSIVRVRRNMSVHDANMKTFRQWWRRSVRCGHAYAEGAWMHGFSAERHWLRESLSSWFWGAALPLAILAVAWISMPIAALICCLYAVLVVRIYRYMRGRAVTPRYAGVYSIFCALAKFPEAQGQALFHARRCAGTPRRLIEYRLP